jgi:hypothetical protein
MIIGWNMESISIYFIVFLYIYLKKGCLESILDGTHGSTLHVGYEIGPKLDEIRYHGTAVEPYLSKRERY